MGMSQIPEKNKRKAVLSFGPRVCKYAPALDASMQVSGAREAACRGLRTVKQHILLNVLLCEVGAR